MGTSPERERFVASARRDLDAFLTSGDRLVMPSAIDAPEVSVVIVTYGKAPLTYACLRALAESEGASFEVTIVDNASTDETRELLGLVDGVRVLLNESNEHFLRGANLGAREARGEHVLFLNNDAQVEPRALSAAVARLGGDREIAVVGGQLIFPDGTLQEAGGIIWRDGDCQAFGRGFDPAEPEFSFVRDVDYVSGAFLMIRRAVWDQLGGFDEAFAPAYYEDTDLCVRVWESGSRVVFEPGCRIRHLEFGSSDRPESALALQRTNRSRFVERQAGFLEGQLDNGPTALPVARMRPHAARRLLFVDECVPHPSYGAGYPRALEIIEAARAAGFFVSVLPLTLRDRDESWSAIRKSVPDDVEVLARPGEAVRPVEAVLAQRPGAYDVVLISRSSVMRAVNPVLEAHPELLGEARVVMDLECVQSVRLERAGETIGSSADLTECDVDAEVALTARADVVTTPAPREAELLRSRGVANVALIGHGIEAREDVPGPAGRDGLLFVGAVYSEGDPNAESIFHFARDVLPVLHGLGVGPRLTVAGTNATGRAFEHPEIDFIGRQDDLVPLYDRARVFVAPTRMASGIPLKVIEAAAHGVPVVCTEILRWQLGWTSGDHLLAASDAEEFASAVARLLEDDDLWRRLQTAALARVRTEYGRDVLSRQVGAVLGAR